MPLPKYYLDNQKFSFLSSVWLESFAFVSTIFLFQKETKLISNENMLKGEKSHAQNQALKTFLDEKILLSPLLQ